MRVYLDTSVVLRFILNQPPLLPEWARWDIAYSSELMGVESRRTFDRLRLSGHVDDRGLVSTHDELARVERSIGVIALTRAVLVRAAQPMPTLVRTLDALHLASAALLREHREQDLVFATHDEQQGMAARALGFNVLGVSFEPA